jgi:hypothetical protein
VKTLRRNFVIGSAASAALATLLILACGDDSSSSAGSSDGGVVFGDGGVVAVDGGVVYADGGAVYADGGAIYADGGPVYYDGGPVYYDGGLVPFDAGPSGCSAGATATNGLGPGLHACSGSVAFADRETLCKPSCHVCSVSEFTSRRAPQAVPTDDYWLAESVGRNGGSDSCTAYGNGAVQCGTTPVYTPMRVCTDTGPDPEGNPCNWTGCGLDSLSNQHFGGCSGNSTAGTLCCATGAPAASGCASGTDSETFDPGMSGCAGKVEWTARDTLCAVGYRACTAREWVDRHGDAGTAHNYWTEDLLNYRGNNHQCEVSTLTGYDCSSSTASDSPMRVCGAGVDPDSNGNQCFSAGCALESAGSSVFMGGCAADASVAPPTVDAGAYNRAGALCCCD